MEQEVISIPELYTKILSAISSLLRKWWLLLGSAMLTAVLAVTLAPNKEYIAKTTFLIKGAKSNSNLFSLASNFGIESNQVDFNKISAISKSDRMRLKLLGVKMNIEGKNKYVAEHLIDEFELQEVWKDKHPSFLAVNFDLDYLLRDSVNSLLLKKINELITVNETNEGVIEIITTFESSDLSYKLNVQLSKMIEDYFYDFELSDKIRTSRTLKKKTDSLAMEIKIAEDTFGEYKDRAAKTIRFEGLKNLNRIQRELEMLNRIYIELITQYELVNFKIEEKGSSFEILDRPLQPLDKSGRGKVFFGLVGFILGGILAALAILLFAYLKKIKELTKS